MIITTSANWSGFRPNSLPGLKSYLADGSHLVSASADIAHSIVPGAAVGTPGAPLTPIDSHPDITDEQRKRMQKAILSFASKNISQLKTVVPDAALPLDGIELLFASKEAFDSFTDPQRTSLVGPAVKSARALSELVDVLKPFIPGLQNNPYVGVACLLVKFGDTAYQLHAEVTATQALGQQAAAQPAMPPA